MSVSPRDINLQLFVDKSFGVIQAIPSFVLYSDTALEGVPPPITSPTSDNVPIVHP